MYAPMDMPVRPYAGGPGSGGTGGRPPPPGWRGPGHSGDDHGGSAGSGCGGGGPVSSDGSGSGSGGGSGGGKKDGSSKPLTKNDGTPDPEILLHLMQRVRLNHFNETFGALGTGAFYSLDLAAAGIGAFKPLTTQSRRDGTVCLAELQLELFGSACDTSIDPDVYASLMAELGVMPDRTLPITADDGTLPCQDTGT